MSRRTVLAIAPLLGEDGRELVRRELDELKVMAEVGDDAFAVVQRVLFDQHDYTTGPPKRLSPTHPTLLLEMMNDLLYQLFVRPDKVRAAIRTALDAPVLPIGEVS
jgi:hypothetical protein